MTLDYNTVGQVKITMLDYIYEILNDFDKADPMGGGTKSSAAPYIILRLKNTVRKLLPNKLWSFITWWRKYYLPPSGLGRTHAPQFHSSPRVLENLTMTIGISWSI